METREAIGEHMREAGERLEREMRRSATFVDEAIVPKVRRNRSVTLRTVSDKLWQLNDQLGDQLGSDSRNHARRRSAGSRR